MGSQQVGDPSLPPDSCSRSLKQQTGAGRGHTWEELHSHLWLGKECTCALRGEEATSRPDWSCAESCPMGPHRVATVRNHEMNHLWTKGWRVAS
jgi:hypothetical protein